MDKNTRLVENILVLLRTAGLPAPSRPRAFAGDRQGGELMKRVVLTALSLMLVISMLAACGGGASSAAASTAAPAASASTAGEASAPAAGGDDHQFFIGLAFGAMDATPKALADQMVKIIEERGWKYVITNADQDSSKFIADVESLCEQKPDVILVRLINDLVVPGLAGACEGAGIPMMIMSNATPFDVNYLGNMGDPEDVRGYPLGDWLNAYIEANPGFVPKIGVVVGDFTAEVCFGRTDNVFETVTTAEKVVESEADPKWTATGGMKVTEDWLQKYSIDELNTLLVWSDEMCVGVIQALQAAGKSPDDYLVLSYDGLDIMYDYVREGWCDASSGLDLAKQAKEMLDVCQLIADGKSDEVQFMNYCYGIYVLDDTNVDAVAAGNAQLDYFDYSAYIPA